MCVFDEYDDYLLVLVRDMQNCSGLRPGVDTVNFVMESAIQEEMCNCHIECTIKALNLQIRSTQ